MDIYTQEEMLDKMVAYREREIQLYPVGFKKFENHYQFLRGGVTDITGYPYMGKTHLLMEIIFNLSQKHNFKHLLHLPDSGKPEQVMSILIHKFTGKSFDKRYQNYIGETEVVEALIEIYKYFQILKLVEDEETNRLKRPTPYDFWHYVIDKGLDTGCIDSWNNMSHPSITTGYLADVLGYRNELADRYEKHFFTVIHPASPTKEKGCFTKEGVLKPADVYNLMGGSEWNNNARNVIAVHKEEKESDEYDIYFRKLKPREVGKTGMQTINLDIPTQRFWESGIGQRLYAYDHENVDYVLERPF